MVYFRNKKEEVTEEEEIVGIRFKNFLQYLNHMAKSATSAASDYGSGLELTPSQSPPSEAPKEDSQILSLLKRKLLTRTSSFRELKHTSLFLHMDTDHSGKLTPNKFRQWLESVGLQLTEEQCKRVLGEHYREEEDGGIDFREFIRMIDDWDDPTVYREPPDPNEAEAPKNNRSCIDKNVSLAQLNIDDTKTDQEILHIVSQHLFSKRKKLVDAFNDFDVNQEGKLNAQQLQMALDRAGYLHVSPHRLSSLVHKFDFDGDGKLSKSDFVRMISSAAVKHENSPQQNIQSLLDTSLSNQHHMQIVNTLDEHDIDSIIKLREALEEERLFASYIFRKMDKDGTNHLSAQELRAGFQLLGLHLSLDHARHIIQVFDTEGTGKLQYHQFLKLLTSNFNNQIL